MKKQFQSKSVPRGTRTIWRYLGALFLLFTFAIGNVMAADTVFKCKLNGSVVQERNDGNSEDFFSFSFSSGSFGWKGGSDVTGCTYDGVDYASAMKFDSKPTLSFTTTESATVIVVQSTSKNNSKAPKFDGTAMTSKTTITGANVWTITDVDAGSHNVRYSSEIWIHCVYVIYPDAGGCTAAPATPTAFAAGSITEDGVTFTITDDANAGKYDIYYSTSSTAPEATTAASATSTAKTKAITGLTASTKYYAWVRSVCDDSHKSAWVALTGGFFTTAAPDPCTTHHWFVATADATANGKTNWDGFTNAVTGTNNQSNSVTIDGTTYNLTKRTGSTTGTNGIILGFTIPANKAGTLYGYMKSSGNGARTLSLKKGTEVAKTNTDIAEGGAWTLITIDAIAPGTYTLSPDQNVQVQMFVLKICDAEFNTITLEYADGATPDGSIDVIDGTAATKPADPTWEHHRFDGWYAGSNLYNWSTIVEGDLTLTAHWTQLYTVTYAAGDGTATGDAPTQVDKAAGETFKVAANTFAVEGKDFDKWNDGTNDYNPDDTYTVGTENVVLTAQWKTASAKYTVIFKDGDTELGTKLFEVGSVPSDAEIDKTKPMFIFAAWQKDDADIALDAEFWATVAKDATVTLTARWEKLYASTIDIEDFIDDQGTSGDWATYLSNHGYAISSTSDVSLDGGDSGNKPADKGLKIKKTGRTITFEVVANKVVVLKVGSLKGGAQIKVNEGEYADLTGASPLSTGASVFSYYYSANVATYTIKTSADDYNIIQSITIRDPFEVSFDANGGEDVASLNGTPSVTLPSATKGTDSFLGWFDGDTKVGEAGDSYTPTADVELVAHWEAVSTDTRIKALTYAIGAGTPVNIYEADKNTFNVVLPYAKSYDAITVATTPNHENASIKAGAVMTVSSLPGSATFTIVAQSGAEEDYTVNFSLGPKDGVSIIKATTNNVVTGLIGGTIDQSYSGTSDSRKLNKNNYFGVALANSETFQEGDVMIVNITTAADLGKFMVYADAARTQLVADQGIVYTKADPSSTGEMSITLPAAANGKTSLYLSREDGDTQWNVTFSYIEVKRPMMPMLTAITINGVDCEKGTGNAYSVTLPEATTDLAALTVVPTIVWNAAATENSIVVNNGAAWQEGANTYKLTDKDGDATTYTITITLQGEAPAPVITTQPADVAYCAGNEPTLTVEATGNELHYAWFKEAGETDEAVGTDEVSYTVEAAGTYYVIVTNHVDGKLDKSITSANAVVTLNTAAAITKQPVNKRDIVSGASVTLSVEATNATGYQWYICDDAEKANASAISGADAANYVFNCTANAYYYCVVGNACGADLESNVVSVKLEPVGCNVLDGTIPSAAPYIYDNGEWTLYAVTSGGKLDGTSRFDDDAEDFDGNTVNAITYGRVGMTFAKDVESLTIYATSSSSDRAISSIKVTTDDVTTGTPSYSDVTFTASAEKLGKKDSSSPYRFVLEANNMLLEAGKKYWLQFSGTVSAFKICYSEALAMPVLPTLSNQELCAGAAYQEFDATITNEAACEGTVSYKWYDVNDTETPVATTATFTPTAEGTYYVVVTHAKAGHITRTAQSANLSVAHFDALTLVSHSEDVFQHMGTAATLSVVATGKNVAYVWYTCSNAAGDDAVAIDPAETEAELTIASIIEGVHYYKVVISHDCDATTLSHVFKVEGWDQLEQVDVTETTTWNMANSAENAIDLSKAPYSCQNERLLLANIDGVNLNASFNSQALMFEGQHIGRTQNEVKHLAGRYLQFNVTKSGYVSVTFASNGSSARTIKVNGLKCQETSNSGATYKTFVTFVQPGSVEIIGMEGNSEKQYVRISEVKFTVKETPDYTRNVSNNIGTLCVDHNVVAGGALGATFYQIASRNELYNDKIDFEEVLPNEELKAGEPYIFKSTTGKIELFYGATVADAPVAVRGMIGSFANTTLDITEENKSDILYIAQNKLWNCEDLVASDLEVVANRAYIVMSDVPEYSAPQQNSAPRRRVTLGKDATQTTTGVDNLNASEQPVKLLINGQIFILRGEKLFDVTGKLVK